MRHLLTVLAFAVSMDTVAQVAPQLIAPGIVSTTNGEYSPAYDPERQELVFMRRTPGRFDYTLYTSRREGNQWTAPKVLPFSGEFRDGGTSFSPDGERVLFDSRRPAHGVAAGSINVWRAARAGNGWTEPELVEQASVNDADESSAGADEFGPIETADGTIVFYSFRSPVRGGAHYTVRGDGLAVRDNTLPDPSAATFVGYLTLSANGAFAVIEGRSTSGTDTDLYYSCRDGERWTPPQAIEAINSPSGEGTPYLTSDGEMLLFASDRPAPTSVAATANLYSVDVDALGIDCAATG